MAHPTQTGARTASDTSGRFERDADTSPKRQARDVRDRQAEEYGGIHWGSAFFGWLVAVGIAVLLTAILSAAGAAIGLTSTSSSQAKSSAGTIGIVGGILLLVVLMVAYYAGGYVAGRMGRFDGPRQGLATWIVGLVVTIVLAIAGAVLGSNYNVLAQLKLPRIPVSEGSLTTGGIIALAAILIGTLIAALAGGKAGTHFHRKVDRVGLS
jgi:amino acid transporter